MFLSAKTTQDNPRQPKPHCHTRQTTPDNSRQPKTTQTTFSHAKTSHVDADDSQAEPPPQTTTNTCATACSILFIPQYQHYITPIHFSHTPDNPKPNSQNSIPKPNYHTRCFCSSFIQMFLSAKTTNTPDSKPLSKTVHTHTHTHTHTH